MRKALRIIRKSLQQPVTSVDLVMAVVGLSVVVVLSAVGIKYVLYLLLSFFGIVAIAAFAAARFLERRARRRKFESIVLHFNFRE